MKMISPPPELMTEVAQQLLASAEQLGLPVTAVETTSSAEFGNGFMVPAAVFDHWFLRRGEAAGMKASDPAAPEPGVFPEPLGPQVPLVDEIPAAEVTGDEVPEVPEPPKRRSRGVAKTTEGEA